MAKNVEIKKNKNENNLSMLKRFSRKVIEAGIINKVKSERYETRKASDYVKKKNKLKTLKKRENYEKLFKLGKVVKKRK
jgi:ribosomal protein S21